MKIQTTIFLFCLISITSIQLTAQWTNIGNNTVSTTRNVGIDTNAPQQKFDVAGAIRIGGDDFGDVDGSIRFNGTNFQGFVGTWKNLDAQPFWSQNGSSDTYFDTGRVGIGTNNPNSALHIDALSGRNPLRAAIAGQTKFHISTNGGASIGTPSAPPGNGLAVSGSTGIGTVSPLQKLEVVGGIKIGNTSSNVNGSIRYNGANFQGYTGGNWVNLDGSSSGTSVWSMSGPEAYYNSGNVGIGTTNPAHLLHVDGDIAVAGSIIAPSDLRLKQDIQPIKEALAIVSRLAPKTYTYKADQVADHGLSEKMQYGLIAQELAEVLPHIIADQAIVDEDGTSYKGIEYTQLIPILTQAIKELSVELRLSKEELANEQSRSKKQFEVISYKLKALEELISQK